MGNMHREMYDFLMRIFFQLKIHFVWKILLGFIVLFLLYMTQRYMPEVFEVTEELVVYYS